MYIKDTNVPFLCGKKTLEQWVYISISRNGFLETLVNGAKKEFKMVTTDSSQYGIVFVRNRGDKEILYLKDKEEDLTSFESVRKVHEVNNHKGSDQLVSAYSRAGLMSPEVTNTQTCYYQHLV